MALLDQLAYGNYGKFGDNYHVQFMYYFYRPIIHNAPK